MNIANTELAKTFVDEVIADHDKIIETRPLEPHAYVERGYLHLFHGDYDRAAQDYAAATRLHPEDRHLAKKLSRLGDVLGIAH